MTISNRSITNQGYRSIQMIYLNEISDLDFECCYEYKYHGSVLHNVILLFLSAIRKRRMLQQLHSLSFLHLGSDIEYLKF